MYVSTQVSPLRGMYNEGEMTSPVLQKLVIRSRLARIKEDVKRDKKHSNSETSKILSPASPRHHRRQNRKTLDQPIAPNFLSSLGRDYFFDSRTATTEEAHGSIIPFEVATGDLEVLRDEQELMSLDDVESETSEEEEDDDEVCETAEVLSTKHTVRPNDGETFIDIGECYLFKIKADCDPLLSQRWSFQSGSAPFWTGHLCLVLSEPKNSLLISLAHPNGEGI